MTEKLLPCPFCGSGEVSKSEGHTGDGKPWIYIECEACAATAEPDLWNRRAAQLSVPEGFRLIAVNAEFDALMFWMDRCEIKGHLENCPDLVEPWEAFEYRELPTQPADGQAQHSGEGFERDHQKAVRAIIVTEIPEIQGLSPENAISTLAHMLGVVQQDADKVDAQPVAYGIFYEGVMQSWAWGEDAAWAIAKEDYDNVKTSILPLYTAPVTTQPDPAMAGDDREAFEEWHRNKFRTKHNSGQPTRDMHNGVYDDEYGPGHQQEMWEAWKASSKRVQPASGDDASVLLGWLEQQTRHSPTGISFDYVRHVEDGRVLESGYRFMRRHFLGERKATIREAIDAAMQQERQP